jgi:hypothetical protein
MDVLKAAQVFALGVCLGAMPVSPGAPRGQKASDTARTPVAGQIAADMTGKHEALPHGVPASFGWAQGPVFSMGNDAKGWKAITAWGVVYEDAKGNQATNTRVNIRGMKTYLLQKTTGKWLLVQNTNAPVGAAYREDFSGDINKPADVRHEPDGSISAVAGEGYNFHFFPAARATIDPNNLGGVVVVLEARLIVGDLSKPDDRSSARYLCGSGADYYPSLDGGWPGDASFNPGVAIGKMKYVRTTWRSFTMTTLTLNELRSNPPPLNFHGIQP